MSSNATASKPVRNKLPATRAGLNHKFSVGGHEGYILAGTDGEVNGATKLELGNLGEIYIHVQHAGSALSGALNCFAIALSLMLQYGVPLEHIVRKYAWQRFEPCGFTTDREIPYATSIIDYVVRWIGRRFIPNFDEEKHTEVIYRPEQCVTSNETK